MFRPRGARKLGFFFVCEGKTSDHDIARRIAGAVRARIEPGAA